MACKLEPWGRGCLSGDSGCVCGARNLEEKWRATKWRDLNSCTDISGREVELGGGATYHPEQ